MAKIDQKVLAGAADNSVMPNRRHLNDLTFPLL
jgi:hypothetical protein